MGVVALLGGMAALAACGGGGGIAALAPKKDFRLGKDCIIRALSDCYMHCFEYAFNGRKRRWFGIQICAKSVFLPCI